MIEVKEQQFESDIEIYILSDEGRYTKMSDSITGAGVIINEGAFTWIGE